MLILCVQNPYIGKKVPKVTESTVVQLLIHYFFFSTFISSLITTNAPITVATLTFNT